MERHLAIYWLIPQGEALHFLKLLPTPPGSTGTTEMRWWRNGWSPMMPSDTRAVCLSNMAPVTLIQNPKLKDASFHPDP